MRTRQKNWTEEETRIARRLMQENAPEEEYRRLLGRSKVCARARLERVDYFSAGGSRRSEPEALTVPTSVWIERATRLGAPRSLTASIFGDPAPGFSALDRKRASA